MLFAMQSSRRKVNVPKLGGKVTNLQDNEKGYKPKHLVILSTKDACQNIQRSVCLVFQTKVNAIEVFCSNENYEPFYWQVNLHIHLESRSKAQ